MPWKKAEQTVRQPFFSASVMCGSVSVTASTSPFSRAASRYREPFGARAELDLVAPHEALQHVQRDVVRAEIERHTDHLVGELLRRVDRRVRRHDHRGVGDDGAAAELAAAGVGRADAAVVAPLAGVVHVRLALLEQLAVAGERIDVFGLVTVRSTFFSTPCSRSAHSTCKPFLLEQALVIGDQFRQGPGTALWSPKLAFSWNSSLKSLAFSIARTDPA